MLVRARVETIFITYLHSHVINLVLWLQGTNKTHLVTYLTFYYWSSGTKGVGKIMNDLRQNPKTTAALAERHKQ